MLLYAYKNIIEHSFIILNGNGLELQNILLVNICQKDLKLTMKIQKKAQTYFLENILQNTKISINNSLQWVQSFRF